MTTDYERLIEFCNHTFGPRHLTSHQEMLLRAIIEHESDRGVNAKALNQSTSQMKLDGKHGDLLFLIDEVV